MGIQRVTGDAGAPAQPFDWHGVIVGHWAVTGRRVAGRRGVGAYRCTSRCGEVVVFPEVWLQVGATSACEACWRDGPGRPDAPGAGMVSFLTNWEGVAVGIDYRNSLRGDGYEMWKEHADAEFLAFIDRTGLGRNFGWKLAIRDCHNRKSTDRSDPAPVVRLRGWHDNVRRCELGVKPHAGPYWFEVDLTTGRTDVAWPTVRAALEAALVTRRGLPAPAAEPPEETREAPPPAHPPEVILGGVDLAHLVRLRNGMDTLIEVGKDIKECQKNKREAEAALAARRAEAEAPKEAADAAAAVADRTILAHRDAQERYVRLHREAAEAAAERDRLSAEVRDQAEARDRAMSAYAPFREALAAAEQDLAVAGKLEKERLAVLAQADELGPLLIALQKFGAPPPAPGG